MWDIRYRPVLFSEVIGQEGTIQILKARLRNGTVLDTSYIFAGGSGQGKTTLARILARAALCPNMDKVTCEPCNSCEQCRAILDGIYSAFEERDAANGGAIEVVREMLDKLPYAPAFGAPCRIWLFDEAHRLSKESQDVLLKPIEDKKVIAIFCTTEGKKIAGPIYGRCEEYDIRRVTRDKVLARVKHILELEKVEYQEEALLIVIDHAGGHVRNVINRLESIAQLGAITTEAVRDNLNLRFVASFYDVLLSLGDDSRVIQLLEHMCEYMSPEDASAGISEAAMNSFRLANGMHADFTYTDRQLAQKVHARFGNTLLTIAERFLKSRNVTKVSLMCEALTLVQNGAVSSTQSAAPPVVMVAPPPQAATPTPVVPPVNKEVHPAILPPAPSPPPAPAAPPKTSASLVASSDLGADGIPIGPLGVDPNAYTTLDHKAIAKDKPRSINSHVATVSFSQTPNRESDDLLPVEWRRIFERLWRRETRADD